MVYDILGQPFYKILISEGFVMQKQVKNNDKSERRYKWLSGQLVINWSSACLAYRPIRLAYLKPLTDTYSFLGGCKEQSDSRNSDSISGNKPNFILTKTAAKSTSFPGSLILPSPGASDTGNEVAAKSYSLGG